MTQKPNWKLFTPNATWGVASILVIVISKTLCMVLSWWQSYCYAQDHSDHFLIDCAMCLPTVKQRQSTWGAMLCLLVKAAVICIIGLRLTWTVVGLV